jgi:hypothetical protein
MNAYTWAHFNLPTATPQNPWVKKGLRAVLQRAERVNDFVTPA